MRRIILLPLAILTWLCSFAQNNISCTEQLYLNLYTNADSTLEVYDMALLTDGGAVLCGTRGVPDTIDPVLIRVNAQGQKVWEKVLQMPGFNYLWKVIRTKDGNFVSSGWITDFTSSNLLVKFDLSGNIIWNKQYSFNSIENPASEFLQEDDAGNLYTAGYFLENNLGFQDRFSVEKYDANGNVTWSKMITPGSGITILHNADFIIRGGSSYMVGYINNYYYASGLFLKINNTTGAVEWSRLYDFNNREVILHAVLPASDGFILCGRNGVNATDTTLFFKTDMDGQLKSTYQFIYPLVRDNEKFSIDETGNVYYALGSRTTDLANDAVTMARINLSSGITWMNQLVTTSGYFPRVSDMKVNDGKIYFAGAGYTNGMTRYAFAGQMYVSGHSACQQLPMSATFSAGNGSSRDTTLLSQDKMRFNYTTSLALGSPSTSVRQLCGINSTCDNLTISSDSVFFCTLKDTLVVNYTKNAECSIEPVIEYNHRLLSLVSNSDGTLKFVARLAGDSYVHVNVNTSCGVISDSIFASYSGLHPKDFMKTTIINRRASQLLQAPKGFASYFWDDGSSGDTLAVKRAGKYYVKITDRCGNQFSDTVTVSLPRINPLNPILSSNAVIQYPSAFTPNGDGRNDFFAPAMQTMVESFHLVVYNVSGKIVFITNDPYAKWNGTQNNIPLSTGTYVWKCSYVIPGAGRRSDNGVVVLIR